MECTATQQAHELAQLHRTVATMADMLEKNTALQEVQLQGMKLWLEEKEKIRDAYHQDDLLWGKGITDMVAWAVAATQRDQEEERKVDTKGVSLEASIHANLTQTGGQGKPQKRQQLQLGRQLKSLPMPKPKPNPTPRPNPAPAPRPALTPTPRTTPAVKGPKLSAPIPTRRWEMIPPRI